MINYSIEFSNPHSSIGFNQAPHKKGLLLHYSEKYDEGHCRLSREDQIDNEDIY
jgi:hypothetical protein